MSLADTFQSLFEFLRAAGYEWEPLSPERLQKRRKEPASFSSLVKYFGLGLPVGADELAMPESLLRAIAPLRPSVSRVGEVWVAHHHWPAVPGHEGEFVYFGTESMRLARQIERELSSIEGKRVLDLGSGAGGLALALASVADEVLGLESCERAVEWSSATAAAQRFQNARFAHAPIGAPAAEQAAGGAPWDVAVFNPPMTLPLRGQAYPHRDGGKLGIELPLRFLDFASRHLRDGGEVFCLATNPIVGGRGLFFDELPDLWKTLESVRLDDHFNHSLHRKENYGALGIERVELWYLRLRREG